MSEDIEAEKEVDWEQRAECFLKQKGYTLIRQIGEGCTSKVYEVQYSNGCLEKRRVAKVPKNEIDSNSLTTIINLSKGDMNEREVMALNSISHPNIIEFHDAFQKEGKTLSVEEHYDAVSLEELVELSGPITDPEKIREMFLQIASGLKHLHLDEKLLHRDIKPSNILIGKKNNHVKITDLQNVGEMEEIDCSLLPTRGGTNYTDPYILNALMKGKETNATIGSEFYALGMTLYYVLTGEPLSEIKLSVGDSDKKIQVAGRDLGMILTQEGKPITRIESDKQERLLKRKLKKVPRQYRRLISNCLSSYERKYSGNSGWVVHDSFRQDLLAATEPRRFTYWKQAVKYMGIFAVTTGILTGAIWGGKLARLEEAKARKAEPSIFQTLSANPLFEDSSIDVLIKHANRKTLEQLRPVFREIKNHDKELDPVLNHKIGQIAEYHRMSKRMMYSLLRSIEMTKEEDSSGYKKFAENRLDILAAPKMFAHRISQAAGLRTPVHLMGTGQDISSGLQYLKRCIGNHKNLSDVYALYFSDSMEEIFSARVRSKNPNYFPRISERGTMYKGYREFMSHTRRNLVDRALAYYYITDNEGKVHKELINGLYRATRSAVAKK